MKLAVLLLAASTIAIVSCSKDEKIVTPKEPEVNVMHSPESKTITINIEGATFIPQSTFLKGSTNKKVGDDMLVFHSYIMKYKGGAIGSGNTAECRAELQPGVVATGFRGRIVNGNVNQIGLYGRELTPTGLGADSNAFTNGGGGEFNARVPEGCVLTGISVNVKNDNFASVIMKYDTYNPSTRRILLSNKPIEKQETFFWMYTDGPGRSAYENQKYAITSIGMTADKQKLKSMFVGVSYIKDPKQQVIR